MNATLAAIIGGKGGECYAYGRFVGRVIARDRKWKVGRAAYWAAYDNGGKWIGSHADYDTAVAFVFTNHERTVGSIPPCPFY